MSPGERLRLALEKTPKRLLYPFLRLGAGRRLDPSAVALSRARRVLVLRELYTVGDTLVATPGVRALKTAHPRLEIGVVAGWRNAALWRGNPRISRLFVLERGLKAWRFACLVRDVRRWRPDIAITMESIRTHPTLDLLARLSGSPIRIRYDGAGFGAPDSNAAYNCLVPFTRDPSARQVDVCAGVLRAFGIELVDRRPELRPGQAAVREAEEALERLGVGRGDAFAVVHTGSKQVHNRWPLERFLAVYRQCRGDAGAGKAPPDRALRTLLSFGPSEEPARAWFLEHGTDAADLLPPLSLEQLAAVLSRASLLVCPDTGVLHVGAAVGVPIVGLYGSGDPAVWKPAGPVRSVRSSATRKVRDIPLEPVLAEVEAALGEGRVAAKDRAAASSKR